MAMTAKTAGRIGRQAAALGLALALAFLMAGMLAHSASAAEMDKGAFKSGCESGGGSYIENNDGSFQCNLRSGGTIKCPDTKSQCTYSAKLTAVGSVSTGGTLQVADGTTTTVQPVKQPVRVNKIRPAVQDDDLW